jgi:uncharacterized membrane protein YeaQ/YmgE (transglycosylase-associated protein family)
MGLIWMIVVGLVVGAVAKAIMPGKDPGGIVVTILLGIGGSIVGGMVTRILGIGSGPGLIGSLLGALLLLWAWRKLKKA